MKPQIHRRGRRPAYGSAVAIWLALVAAVAGCERHRTVVEAAGVDEVVPAQEAPISSPVLATEHAVSALNAKNTGNFLVCADEYAEAARASSTPSRITVNWYEASRCSARAGDFRTSTFYLSAAASSGFAELTTLMREPLFRPLYGGSRWDLVVEVVTANERALPAREAPAALEKPVTPICKLIEHVRERL